MKQHPFYLYFAIFAVLVLGACQKRGREVVLPEPATKAYAQVITFSEPVNAGGLNIKALELTEGGRYIALLEESTKAFNEGANVVVGRYHLENGVFVLSDIGTLSVEADQATLTPEGQEPVTVSATITQTTTSGERQSNAARTWTVKYLYAGISGENLLGGEKRFEGLDMEEVGTYVKSWGVDLSNEDMEKLRGRIVDEIIVTGANSFVITFTSGKAYYGTWELTGDNFRYCLSKTDNPLLVSGTAGGTFTFPSASSAVLTANGSMETASGKEFDITLEFELQEKQ